MKMYFLFISMLFVISSCIRVQYKERDAMVIQYQSRNKQIENNSVPISHLDKDNPVNSLPEIHSWKDGFTLTFSIQLESIEAENTLLEIPDMLKVCTRLHQREKWAIQNYPSYPMPDKSIPVLEAILWFEDETGNTRPLTIGLPLSLLKDPFGKHDICLQFIGVEWSIYVDDRLYDNDFAIGYPQTKGIKTWKIDAAKMEMANLYVPALPLKEMPAPNPIDTFNI